MARSSGDGLKDAGSDENTDMRRSGGSADDPHGGVEHDLAHQRKGPQPDPLAELARVNSEAQKKADRSPASDLRGGAQPTMRSQNRLAPEGAEGLPRSERGKQP